MNRGRRRLAMVVLLVVLAALLGMLPRMAVTGLRAALTGDPGQKDAFRAYRGVWQVAWRGTYQEDVR